MDRPSTSSIQQGDAITTIVDISTGIFGGHTPDNQNEASYYVVFRDRALDRPEIPIKQEERQLFVQENSQIRNNYTRTLIQGIWLLSVEVREDDRDGELLKFWNETIAVEPSTLEVVDRQLALLERQTAANEDNARYAIISAILSPAAAVAAAFLAGRWAFRAGLHVEELRQESERQNEQEFVDRVRALVRHELGVYKAWLNLMLQEAGKWDKVKDGVIHDRYVLQSSSHWREIYYLKAHWPRQYLALPVEQRIRALEAQSMQKIEEAIARFQTFVQSDLNHDVDDDGKRSLNRFHFDEADVKETIKMIDDALGSF